MGHEVVACLARPELALGARAPPGPRRCLPGAGLVCREGAAQVGLLTCSRSPAPRQVARAPGSAERAFQRPPRGRRVPSGQLEHRLSSGARPPLRGWARSPGCCDTWPQAGGSDNGHLLSHSSVFRCGQVGSSWGSACELRPPRSSVLEVLWPEAPHPVAVSLGVSYRCKNNSNGFGTHPLQFDLISS